MAKVNSPNKPSSIYQHFGNINCKKYAKIKNLYLPQAKSKDLRGRIVVCHGHDSRIPIADGSS